MNDITIIFLTVNRLPKNWTLFQKEKLLQAAGDIPIITISREPLDWGINMLQTEPYGASNVWFQLLKGAKVATTKFIAVAEDDVLYPKEHFEFRPPEDFFAYNSNRLNVFAWSKKPTYSWRAWRGNFTLIAGRKLVIEALEERFRKYPEGTPVGMTGEIGKYEAKLKLARRETMWFATKNISVVHVDHEYGLDHLSRNRRKAAGILQSYDIPYWGKAEDIINRFKEQ